MSQSKKVEMTDKGLSVPNNVRIPFIEGDGIGADIWAAASKVLDLYSGSGILGFECISRGANSLTFIENNSQNVKLLFKNKTKFENAEILILKKNVESFFKQSKEFYDLIFADPPYGKIDYTWLFDSCIEKLSKNGKLIVEMNNNNFSYKNCIEKVYGDTKVLLFTKV